MATMPWGRPIMVPWGALEPSVDDRAKRKKLYKFGHFNVTKSERGKSLERDLDGTKHSSQCIYKELCTCQECNKKERNTLAYILK